MMVGSISGMIHGSQLLLDSRLRRGGTSFDSLLMLESLSILSQEHGDQTLVKINLNGVGDDILMWTKAKNGRFSAKSLYETTIPLSSSLNDALSFNWKRLWKVSGMVPGSNDTTFYMEISPKMSTSKVCHRETCIVHGHFVSTLWFT